ncbi:MAG: S-layer homology domain-containing protein, partial [Oscillospiraceae bacterium]|nr:S-layer homology domain-containing protein [Oscillospiraceae bacterium]
MQTAYELGLVAGVDTNTFAPTDPITIAQTLVLACRIHSIYYGNNGQFTQGSPWYQVYVDYAAANGIIAAGAFTDYSAPANRQIFAYILANALPESALPAINSITAGNIPDSGNIAASFLPGVLWLYNAGILTGSDAYGSFNAASSIQRSEVAAIAARMAIPSERKTFTPQPK